MTPLAATDRLFFERADAVLDRAAAEASLSSALAGATTASSIWNTAKASRSASTTAASAAPGSTPPWASACARWPARPPATPMPAKFPSPRCAARRRAWRRWRPATPGVAAEPPRATNSRLYSDANPLGATEFLLAPHCWPTSTPMRAGKDPRVVQVMASIAGEWQAVQIMRADGTRVADLRPLVRLNVSVVVERDGRRETGSYGAGGRFAYDHVTAPAVWRGAVDEALRQALVNLDSVPARPARWRSCWARAGPASCCTRRSATGWRATSTARRPRPSPDCWASGSPCPASPWSTTARSPTGAAA